MSWFLLFYFTGLYVFPGIKYTFFTKIHILIDFTKKSALLETDKILNNNAATWNFYLITCDNLNGQIINFICKMIISDFDILGYFTPDVSK